LSLTAEVDYQLTFLFDLSIYLSTSASSIETVYVCCELADFV